MVGGGSKRDEGFPAISSTNIFSALESRRKKSAKKKSDRSQTGSPSSSGVVPSVSGQATLQSWAPTPVSVTSWADCEEDDDEYFALPTLPPLPDQELGTAHDEAQEDEEDRSNGEESDGDEDVEEEGNEENEEPQHHQSNQFAADISAVLPAPELAREPDRQLSKKQLKMKELAEFEAVLAELGLNQEDKKEPLKVMDIEEVDATVDGKEEPCPAMGESKSSKRRKAKKEKSFKGGKEEESVEESDGVPKEFENEGSTSAAEVMDRSEMLKKVSSLKKKKSLKESDAAAKAAAAEAAARAWRLAAAKKKEKTHYNQQPVR